MSDYFTNLLKESAEKTLSDIDSADAAQWLKNLSVLSVREILLQGSR